MSCAKYGHTLPEKCTELCGYEDCPKHNLYKTEPKKPTRYEQFREQTATIEGLVEWCCQPACVNRCQFCAVSNSDCLAMLMSDLTDDAMDEYCKDGIKAYWEGVNE